MTETVMILGMAALTFGIRIVLLLAGERLVLPAPLREALEFVPVTVLVAIIVPMVLAPGGGGLELTWRNPHLVGAAAAVAVCLKTRHALLTIALGLLAFFLWQGALWQIPPSG